MSLLEVTEGDKAIVRRQLNLTEDDIKRDVKILQEWMKKQPHLPQGIQSDLFFEQFLIRNKGRVEKTKKNVDVYYTIKTIWSEIYQGVENARPSKCPLTFIPTFRLTQDKGRLLFCKYYKNTADTFVFLKAVRQLFAELEILCRYDYSSSLYIVIDMTEFRMEMLKIYTPDLMKKCFTAISEVYSHRVAGMLLYKPPTWIELFLNFLKPIMKSKIYDRISLHNDIDSLLKVLPKDSLPSDYGGEDLTVEEMLVQWDKLVTDHKQYLEEIQTLKSNEKLRVGECKFDTQMFGVDGTFKKLNLD